MNEEEKINQVLEQYSHYFQTSTADVAHSIKGVFMFYIEDSRNGEYYSFKTFASADELERIIQHEIADDMNTAIEVGIENLNVEINERNISYSNCEYGTAINHLADSLDTIYKEYSRWRDTIQHAIDGLTKYTEKNKNESCN